MLGSTQRGGLPHRPVHRRLNMDLRRIVAFLSRTVLVRTSAVKQKSPLLDLPLDLIFSIFDELRWPEKVVLSQTCRDLWHQLRPKCSSTLREATAIQRLEYLTTLGHILPDHYLCAGCCALHLVDPKDIPVTGCDVYGHNLYRTRCPLPEPLWSRHRSYRKYAMAFRHVQLAIKYSRMKGVHQHYRARIMQKSVVSHPQYYSIGMTFVAEPIIVYGRFILMTMFEFYEGLEEVSYSTLVQIPVLFCPHHSIGTFTNHNDAFVTSLRSAFRRSSDTCRPCYRAYSCDRCPSDYSIVIKDKKALISIWHDLGTGVSPEDPYWQSHIWDDKNNHYKGTQFPYQHGSIFRMYYSSGT